MVDRFGPGDPATLALGALATWRLTHLLVEEDGPADLVLRLRRAAGSGWTGRVMDCFYCSSVWVALPVAAVVGSPSWSRRLLTWVALSGAACLLEQATQPPATEEASGGATEAPGPTALAAVR